MEITIGKFKIKPYQNNLCWEVWELRPAKERKTDSETASVPAEGELWQFTGKYPSDLESALLTVYELSLKKSGFSGDLKAAIREVRQIAEEVKRTARNVTKPDIGEMGAE